MTAEPMLAACPYTRSTLHIGELNKRMGQADHISCMQLTGIEKKSCYIRSYILACLKTFLCLLWSASAATSPFEHRRWVDQPKTQGSDSRCSQHTADRLSTACEWQITLQPSQGVLKVSGGSNCIYRMQGTVRWLHRWTQAP